MAYSSVDLSDGLAEFNKSIRDGQPARHVAMTADRVYSQVRAIEKPEETDMRLKLLSPGEMNADQKQTYDESIAGKRGAPPPPMMAWLNSPEMARHATRLGAFLRFDTLFPAKLSEIAILVTARHWTSHYEWYAHKRLALKSGMDPSIIEAIRDRRPPPSEPTNKCKTIRERRYGRKRSAHHRGNADRACSSKGGRSRSRTGILLRRAGV